VTDYNTTDAIKTYLGIGGTENDTNIADAVAAATRDVNSFCGRRFDQDVDVDGDPSATARTYAPTNPTLAIVDDISTLTDLVVKTDEDDDGVFETTWTIGTDFELEPANGVGPNGASGWPYWRIVAVGSKCFRVVTRRTLQVTAAWGWAAVPADVKQAHRLLAAGIYKRKYAPFGVAGYGADGLLVRVREDPKVEELLHIYRRASARRGLMVA
jgi:hypothetical protein